MFNGALTRAPGMMPIRTRGMGFPRLGGVLAGMGNHFAEGGDVDAGVPAALAATAPPKLRQGAQHAISKGATVGALLDQWFPGWRSSGGAANAAAPGLAGLATGAGAAPAPGAPQSAGPSQVVPYDTPSGLNYARGGTAPAAQGHVRGAGDGTDDKIDAKLSDGEFVISADVVSHLGNGSNDAGAKKLQGMMDSVRAQKSTGGKFPPPAKAPLSYIKGHGIKKAEGGKADGRAEFDKLPPLTAGMLNVRRDFLPESGSDASTRGPGTIAGVRG